MIEIKVTSATGELLAAYRLDQAEEAKAAYAKWQQCYPRTTVLQYWQNGKLIKTDSGSWVIPDARRS